MSCCVEAGLAFSMYFAKTIDESQTVVPRFKEFGSCQSLKSALHIEVMKSVRAKAEVGSLREARWGSYNLIRKDLSFL